MDKNFSKIAIAGIAASIVVYTIGWFIDIIEIDAAQYAAMSLEMIKRGDYLTFTDHGKDYLDKPPMIFWISGLSMSLFGANEVAYRIPALLATLLALYSTYRFTIIYYSKETGLLAALILATLQATFLINHDVRTDTNLMAFYIFSLWQLAAYLEYKKTKYFIAGFIGIGLAMLAKGPIGLIAPALAIGGHLLFTGNWKTVINPKWLVGLLITAAILFPMSYGLYHQFDNQPHKLVNGETGVSGLRFFYWTQSFGRITGESEWNNGASPFFLSHSTLWAFAPWSLFLVLALLIRLKDAFLYLTKKIGSKEFITLFGFLLPFIALSVSRYQLPHYAFIVYPLGAVLTAEYIQKTFYQFTSRWSKGLFTFQIALLYVVLAAIFFLVWIPFPGENTIGIALFAALAGLYSWVVFRFKTRHKLVLACIVFIIGANLILNSYFYPNILEYQAGSQLGMKAKDEGAAEGNFYSYQGGLPHSLNFYSGVLVRETASFDTLVTWQNCFVFTNMELLDQFKAARPDLEVLASSGDYPVSRLRGKFLNPDTRDETLKQKVLIKL